MSFADLARNRNFRALFTASACTNLGDGLLAVAFPWFATLLTRDPVLVGAVAAARQVPWLVFALPAGVLTDRFNRRNILILADLARLVLALAAAALALTARGEAAVWLLIGLTFLLGSAEVIRDNTAQTIVPDLVAKPQLEQANGLLWSTEQLAGQFIGPPLAGYLIGFAVALPFGIEAALLALAVALVAGIRLPPQPARVHQPFGPALRAGVHYLWHRPALRRLALVLGFYNLIGAMFYAVLVLYAQDVLGLSAFGYGRLMAFQALGGLAGSLIGPAVLRRIGPDLGLIAGIVSFTLSAAALALTSSLWLISAAMALEAFGNMLWNIASVSYRQRSIPSDLLGRVNAAFRFFGTGPGALGALAGGLVVAVAGGMGQTAALHLLYALVTAGALAMLVYAAFRLRLN